MNYADLKTKLLQEILDNIPSDSILGIMDFVDFEKDYKERFIPLQQFVIENSFNMGFIQPEKYYRLSPLCIQFLKEQLPCMNAYLCHYMIFKGTDVQVAVLDSHIFEIKSSIRISDELIKVCEEEQIYVTKVDVID